MRKFAFILSLALTGVMISPARGDSLPSSFRSWSASGPASASIQLDQVADSNASVLREYGLLSVAQQSYSRGKSAITARLFSMRDATAAYGAYTYLLNEQMAPADLSVHASVSRDRALVVLGDRLLEIIGEVGAASPSDLKALVAHLKPANGSLIFPAIGDYFPEKRRIRNSERYLMGPQALNTLLPDRRGDWVGFGSGAEAQLARYRIGAKELSMLLIVYPTPQLAVQKQVEFVRWMNQSFAEATKNFNGPLAIRRKGSLLAVVLAPGSPEEAAKLLEQIRYETQVTWNEPNHTLKDPTIGEIVVGTLVGTGIFLLLALAAGMGFGGARLLVKRLLPGKVFDRPDRLELIQLGLSSKPIEAKDFYK